jgi:hypothetical protein
MNEIVTNEILSTEPFPVDIGCRENQRKKSILYPQAEIIIPVVEGGLIS